MLKKLSTIKSLVSCWNIDINTITLLLQFIKDIKENSFYKYENYLKGGKCTVMGGYEKIKNEVGPSLQFLGMELEPAENIAALESLDKTRTLICIQTTKSCYPRYIDSLTNLSVLNAGDGFSENPPLAINDLFTIYEQKKHIDGLKIGFCGNIFYSNVFRSLIFLLIKTNSFVGVFAHPLLYAKTFNTFGIKYFLEKKDFMKNDWDVIYSCEFESDALPYKEILPKNEYEKYFTIDLKDNKALVLSSDTSYYITANQSVKTNLKEHQKKNSFYTYIALILWLSKQWKKS